MNPIRKHWRRILLSATLLVFLTASSLVFWAGSEIASPSRRPLMDYHREFLASPAAHGLVIDRFTASDGTPCLVCTPDPSGRLGERGTLIRTQLAAGGHELAPAGHIVGTLVLVHGRKGRKEDYLPIAERLCASGFRCLIPDMPAHGDHPARIATYGIHEADLPSKVLDEAARKFSFAPQPAGLIGMSMGGSVVMHAAGLPDAPWRALVVISSFDSFSQVIDGQASRFLGDTLGPLWAKSADAIYRRKSGISIAEIQPHRHASSPRLPTLIAHGSSDRVISMASGRRLFESLQATNPIKWIEVPGADHDDVLITAYPIYAEIAGWMLHHIAAR